MPTSSGQFRHLIGNRQTVIEVFEPSYSVQETNVMLDLNQGSWSRTSVRTPGYRRIPKKDLPMNSFSYLKEEKRLPTFSLYTTITRLSDGKVVKRESRVGPSDTGLRYPSISSAILTRLNDVAINKVLNKVKDQTVNVAVAAAESQRTIDMIAKTATTIASAARDVRRGNVAGAASHLGIPTPKSGSKAKGVANRWLELQYGWMPLLNDVYGAAEFLAKQNFWTPRQRVVSGSKYEDSQSFKEETTFATTVDKLTWVYTVKYTIFFSEPSGGVPETALGLTNPAAVAWEIVPFSFVADWFLPVGDAISALDGARGLTFLKGCQTSFARGYSTRNETWKTFEDDGNLYEYVGVESASLEVVQCVRSVITSFPTATLPVWKNPFSTRHVLNAIALLAQAVK